MPRQSTILIADDHELIHNGLADMLKDVDEYLVVGHAYNGQEAIDKAKELEPDIVLMDISMPILNGIEATTAIVKNNPGIKVIALSQHQENEYITRMIQAGCYGYLLKNSRKQEILRAFKDVIENKKYMNPIIIDQLFTAKKTAEPENTTLTRRELEILQGIADGKHNTEIAESLNISIRTVETHRRNLMQKLKVNTVVDLLKTASRNKLIDF